MGGVGKVHDFPNQIFQQRVREPSFSRLHRITENLSMCEKHIFLLSYGMNK